MGWCGVDGGSGGGGVGGSRRSQASGLQCGPGQCGDRVIPARSLSGPLQTKGRASHCALKAEKRSGGGVCSGGLQYLLSCPQQTILGTVANLHSHES